MSSRGDPPSGGIRRARSGTAPKAEGIAARPRAVRLVTVAAAT